MNNLFTYNIARTADECAFRKACVVIENSLTGIRKEDPLVDVDGTVIQIYNTAWGKIKVFCDVEVDAVYADSDVDLSALHLSDSW